MATPVATDDSSVPSLQRQPKFCFRSLQDMVPARVVLYMLSFSGFLVSFMLRTDINIAIVAMVKLPSTPTNSTEAQEKYCFVPPTSNVSEQPDVNITSLSEEGEFDWRPTTQSAILGSFYWCYIMSQIIGGVLTHQFGTKIVFGFAQLVTAVCSLLIPQAAVFHYSALIVLRSIQGFASGLTWPAMYALIGHWIPSNERSRFMSSIQGMSLGIGLTYPLCGFLIAHYGWRIVFYTTGSIGLCWCVVWWLLAFDLPHKHPRITRSELAYIQRTIGNTVIGRKEMKVPWMSILTSAPAWAIGVTTFGRIWVYYVFIIYGPLYMKTVLGFSIQKNGLLSGVPFLCSYLLSVIFCYLADYLIVHGILSLTNVRKLFTAVSQIIPGLLLLAIGYLGCEINLVLVSWFIAVTVITAAFAGAMANAVDIAPNLAGPVLAFAQTIHMSAGFLSPLTAGVILEEDTSLVAWRKVFGTAAVVAIGTYSMFQLCGTAEVQSWNYPDGKIPVKTAPEDLQLLSAKPLEKNNFESAAES